MPYDPELAERLAYLLAGRDGMQETKMFGGVGWLLSGNMCIGAYKEYLVLRVGTETADRLLKMRHVKPMDITGKPMKGWVMVAPAGYVDEEALAGFIENAFDFVSILPPK
ncbi:TfoX/Sxy family protein [Methylocaldum sp. GT1TLB]|jgi:hypothetical protein|uniref:TfoX/Sxy family protein n=1 Tax=Methylocaldum sp. GT1TLB TaxID=3438965 RepID=UPI003DA1A5F5